MSTTSLLHLRTPLPVPSPRSSSRGEGATRRALSSGTEKVIPHEQQPVVLMAIRDSLARKILSSCWPVGSYQMAPRLYPKTEAVLTRISPTSRDSTRGRSRDVSRRVSFRSEDCAD